VNRADGISEIEGKAARVAASEQSRERVSNWCLWTFIRKGDACVSRENLNRSMENAGVERRQFHVMLFGQFSQIQIGKFSAGLRGDSLRRKIVRDKSAAMFPKKFRKSMSANLRFGPKRECLATADSQKTKFANRASGRLFPAQPALNSRLVLMVPPDCGNQHGDIK
jgi:hypothetical protein